MLDTIATMIAQALDITNAKVAETRDRLLEEQAAGGRYAASTALEHPEGSTTALPEAAMRAQNSYAALRKRVEKELPRALSLVLAAEIAKERRDEAEKARDQHWELENERLDTGVHDATRGHFKRLFQHGVHPHNLKQHRNEEVAILADLTRWKAFDPLHEKADNPWRDILGIYTTRLVLRPGYGVTVTRSVPGIAVPPARASDPDHYLFAKLLAPGGKVAATVPAPVPTPMPIQPVAIQSAAISDPIGPEDALTDQGPVAEEPNGVDVGNMLDAAVTRDEEVLPADPYRLPAGLPQAQQDALMAAAEKVVDADPTWEDDLAAALDDAADETEGAIIAAVAAKPDIPGATPYRYFVDVARADGCQAACHACRDATIRRVAFEMAAAKPATTERADGRLTSLVSMLSQRGRDADPAAS